MQQLRAFIVRREWRGRHYLISPLADFLMVGGGGLILAVLILWFVPTTVINDDTAKSYSALLAAFVVYHVFAINFPHFATSYQITYSRLSYMRKKSGLPPAIRWRYWFAILGFPVLYVGYCAFAFLVKPDDGLLLFGLLVNLMFFTVGWHYCKQCFGILMVLSAVKKLYFTRWERRILLSHSWLIWIVSWARGNVAFGWLAKDSASFKEQYWGVPYYKIGIMSANRIEQFGTLIDIGISGLIVLFALSVWVIVRSARRAGKLPSLTASLGYFMAYPLLMVASYFHPLWIWILPAVHSLQYWLFVLAYRRGELSHKFPKPAPEAPVDSHHLASLRWHAFASFIAIAVFIGAVQFSWLPHLLDAVVNPANTYHTPLLFMMIVHVFVNVHHYFIDNVIWRKENPEVARNLMARVS